MAKQEKSPAKPKITIIPGRGVSQTINYLLEDRDDLEWLVAVGRNKSGEIFFYDTGGDIVEDLGTLDYLKQRIIRAHLREAGRGRGPIPRRRARPAAPGRATSRRLVRRCTRRCRAGTSRRVSGRVDRHRPR